MQNDDKSLNLAAMHDEQIFLKQPGSIKYWKMENLFQIQGDVR